MTILLFLWKSTTQPKLNHFLKTKNSAKPVTYGYDFKTLVERGYHSGGAGYVLSNEALKRLNSQLSENYKKCRNAGAEDVLVAKCLRKLRVYPDKSTDDEGRERFHLLSPKMHLKGKY